LEDLEKLMRIKIQQKMEGQEKQKNKKEKKKQLYSLLLLI